MPEHRVKTQEEWQAEREALLAKEKELTRLGEMAGPKSVCPATPLVT